MRAWVEVSGRARWNEVFSKLYLLSEGDRALLVASAERLALLRARLDAEMRDVVATEVELCRAEARCERMARVVRRGLREEDVREGARVDWEEQRRRFESQAAKKSSKRARVSK